MILRLDDEWFSKTSIKYLVLRPCAMRLWRICGEMTLPNFLRTTLIQYAIRKSIRRRLSVREGSHPRIHGNDRFTEEVSWCCVFGPCWRWKMAIRSGWPGGRLAAGWRRAKRSSVQNAPTSFGSVGYEIVSDIDKGKIGAAVEMPSRRSPHAISYACAIRRRRRSKASRSAAGPGQVQSRQRNHRPRGAERGRFRWSRITERAGTVSGLLSVKPFSCPIRTM